MVLGAALSGCSIFGSSDPAATGPDAPIELADDGSVKNSLATLTRRYQDYDVTIDVLRLSRYEKATRVEFAVTPRSNGATSTLSTSILGGINDASGVYLLDPVGLRKYPVLESSDDTCICSSKLSGFELDQPTLLFADFPVAPDSVKSLSLVVPEIGPLPPAEIS
jgi:hypothetical protein